MLAVAVAVTLAVPPGAAAALTLAQIGTFSSPIYVTTPPGDTARLFVVEQGGAIRVARDGVTLGTPFLDITSRVLSGGERGLLSMAFAPDYATSGLFYVYYTAQNNGDIEVDRFHVSSNPDVADPSSDTMILDNIPTSDGMHQGGSMHFGAGTRNYRFIWAMGGENQAFDDMDHVPLNRLR